MTTVAEINDAIRKLSENEQGELLRWLEIQVGMREMVEQVARLTQCHVIWWEIANSKNVKRYSKVLQEYRDFFEPVAHILVWQGFFTICYQLFDERPDSKHIKFRIEQLERTDAGLSDKLRQQIKSRDVLSKIKAIRHKVSAHRAKSGTPQLVVTDEAVTGKELEGVVEFVQDIVSTLVEALGVEKKSAVLQKMSACQGSTLDNTFQVLRALAQAIHKNE
ncbi:MAG TPA: hypothetical protein VGY56_16890 [Verrucomicrobiae bacterium]|nr:hypothetical protein [Verrucomicrobiae bacterium]